MAARRAWWEAAAAAAAVVVVVAEVEEKEVLEEEVVVVAVEEGEQAEQAVQRVHAGWAQPRSSCFWDRQCCSCGGCSNVCRETSYGRKDGHRKHRKLSLP
jgi:MinD superfamily P-loop ATPase